MTVNLYGAEPFVISIPALTLMSVLVKNCPKGHAEWRLGWQSFGFFAIVTEFLLVGSAIKWTSDPVVSQWLLIIGLALVPLVIILLVQNLRARARYAEKLAAIPSALPLPAAQEPPPETPVANAITVIVSTIVLIVVSLWGLLVVTNSLAAYAGAGQRITAVVENDKRAYFLQDGHRSSVKNSSAPGTRIAGHLPWITIKGLFDEPYIENESTRSQDLVTGLICLLPLGIAVGCGVYIHARRSRPKTN